MASGSLFDVPQEAYEPLAARMRPRNLADYLGQEHILGAGKPLRVALEQGMPHSMILWGPPGVGKTTLARLVANVCDARFESLSAVLAGVKDIRAAVDRAKMDRAQSGRRTILFVDEVHRFNKAQQDAFLPHIEDGTVIFVGATTENPSFELNNALLSRARVYVLKSLDNKALLEVLNHALHDEERGLGRQHVVISDDVKDIIVQAADGDARRVLNLLEVATDLAGEGEVTREILEGVLVDNLRRFDNKGEAWYDQISAFHKSVRGSSPDGALYWMARIIDGGADPLYIVRRLVAIASEDIGNADPRALEMALNAWQAFERLGAPEGYLAIAHATVYCASAPKSNKVYLAMKAAFEDVRSNLSHEVPMHLRNAPTKLMAELGYHKGYRYAHDEDYAYAAGESYFPEAMEPRKYYQPSDRGLEHKISEKLRWLESLDAQSANKRR
ncbi:replication-associated recombination protein A [Parendozoicomonas haliclonae]|uniref:Replication-associated recombination protein A n=1 Tax=Parendozoicomonas haliclonae TaxID=1960125 RepID=A0A1X7ALM7_9GAMM|nr:replication-associated recombination protein A [Parendozoicomonas haliclonae]SMA49008.1 Replication-associated recombination protein A [Parendozoicomonas haliclonae]